MKNVILTNLSTFNDKAVSGKYDSDIGVIEGTQTNDAPMKYLLRYLSDKAEDIKIIAIVTEEADSSFLNLEGVIEAFRAESSKNIKIKKVSVCEDKIEASVGEIVAEFSAGDNVFVDTTGGFRSSIYLLMAVIRVLEYSGISVSKAIYSKFSRNNESANRIVDVTGQYRMFELINSVNSFSNFGNSYELEAFFSFSDNEAIRETISAMNDFSDAISVCRTADLSAILERLNNALEVLQNTKLESMDMLLFQQLISLIRKKFYMENNRLEYPSIVKWCLDNRLIQQAVTIYVEKMPEYLFSTKVLSYDPTSVNTGSFSKNFDIYYNLLYNGLLKLTTSITFSQYPVGNLLFRLKRDDPAGYREICTVNSINDLSIKDQLTQDERRGILNLIRVKNAIFSGPNVKRTAEEIESRKQNSKLRDFVDTDIFDSMATTSEAFVNGLLKEKKYIHLLQGEFSPYVPRVWAAADLNVVEHLERVVSENKGMYSFNSKIDNNYMKELLRNLIYVKRYVRNALNHASEERHITEEYDEYFREMGYNVSAELSVTEIESLLRKAVDLIIKISF